MSNRTKWLLAISSISLVIGCAAPPTFTPLAFDPAEYAPYAVAGTGIVNGQVFAKTRGGDVKKGAGNKVYLMPATSFGEQRYREALLGGKLAAVTPDPRHAAAVLSTVADGEGRFEFTELPAGKYYVFSTITWEVAVRTQALPGTTELQGGLVVEPVQVTSGKTVKVVLTR